MTVLNVEAYGNNFDTEPFTPSTSRLNQQLRLLKRIGRWKTATGPARPHSNCWSSSSC